MGETMNTEQEAKIEKAIQMLSTDEDIKAIARAEDL